MTVINDDFWIMMNASIARAKEEVLREEEAGYQRKEGQK